MKPTIRGIALSVISALPLLWPMPASSQISYVNFEGKQTSPLRLSPDGTRLYAVNTPDARLSVFELTHASNPILMAEIPVGIEPISVHPLSNDEAWVVNEVSDSVSVVSVSRGIVTDTLPAGDEPSDIVVAAGRAFVTCSRNNLLRVFDLESHAELAVIPLAGINPRALAVSVDGTRVYAAFALSGNRTTMIPPSLAPPQPMPTLITNPPPRVGLIVDAADPAWADVIPYEVLDHDVVEIHAETLQPLRYFSRLGTVNLGLAVNPRNGDLWVASTDARNLTRFEPTVRGHLVDNLVSRVHLADGQVTSFDLNPGLDYAVLPNLDALATALAQPTAIEFDPSGDFMYVASFGTDRVARVGTDGVVQSRIEIGPILGHAANPRSKRGPRGLALHAASGHLYALNRIANTITVIDTVSETIVREFAVGSFDPTPTAIREGRGFLYDAKLSGNGTAACASCHVDAEMDMLAWDLGNPNGAMETATVMLPGGVPAVRERHPMKGPMTTQTLRGLQGLEPLHWRGDRASFLAFNGAFDSLLGGTMLSNEDMAAFRAFINSIVFQPNPNQRLDRGLPATLEGGNPAAGRDFFFNTPVMDGVIACVVCHAQPAGTDRLIVGDDTSLRFTQHLKTPQLRNVYQKLLFTNSPGAQSLSGFGLTHNGVDAGLLKHFAIDRFDAVLRNDVAKQRDVAAFILCFDTGTAPSVGFTLTLRPDNVDDPAIVAAWDILETQTATDSGLIVKGTVRGSSHGLLYDRRLRLYRFDRAEASPLTRVELIDLVRAGDTLTVQGVPLTSRLRMAIDRDANGTLDGDEVLPVLSATASEANLILSWPSTAIGVVLETSDTLTTGAWRVESNLRQSNADTIATTIPRDSGQRFYRLRRL